MKKLSLAVFGLCLSGTTVLAQTAPSARDLYSSFGSLGKSAARQLPAVHKGLTRGRTLKLYGVGIDRGYRERSRWQSSKRSFVFLKGLAGSKGR